MNKKQRWIQFLGICLIMATIVPNWNLYDMKNIVLWILTILIFITGGILVYSLRDKDSK